jgi:hypothetical protein
MFKHATLAAWQRDGHEGTYTAVIDGWTLRVAWHPESGATKRGFSWTAEGPGGQRLAGGAEEPLEEIENAMVAAEEAAKHARKVGEPMAPEGGGDAAHARSREVREANEGP